MDEVVANAVSVLLNAGWKGAAIALGLVLLYALAKAYGVDLLRLLKPTGPQPLDPERDPSLPDAQAVDSAGVPVGSGPPPETDSGSGG